MNTLAPANWYPDPLLRYEFRYWNGVEWTEHVATRGVSATDPIQEPPAPSNRQAKIVQREVSLAGPASAGRLGGGTLFTEQVLVVSQKAKLVEVNAEYSIYDQYGREIGAVREVGQSLLKKAVRTERYTSQRLQVVDEHGQVLLTLTKPVALMRLRVVVRTADGVEVGEIVHKWASVFGKNSFSLESRGKPVGSINGEDTDSWDFNIQDVEGTEVARITKTAASWRKGLSKKADSYVVDIPRSIGDPLMTLIVAASVALDTMLRQ